MDCLNSNNNKGDTQDNKNNAQSSQSKQLGDLSGEEEIDLLKRQFEDIKREAEGNSPLIGEIEGVEILQIEFEHHPAFLQKIFSLRESFPKIRRIRRDGSCFYRSYLYRIFEHIVEKKDLKLQEELLATIKKSKEELQSVGYEEMVLEIFYDAMIEKLQQLPTLQPQDVIKLFSDKYESDTLVMYLRFLTSGALKRNAALYECYLEDGMTIDRFCAVEVDPIDKEADQIAIMALIGCLNVPIRIVYLDANVNKVDPDILVLPEMPAEEQSKVFVNLLYRPGHYDIAYPL